MNDNKSFNFVYFIKSISVFMIFFGHYLLILKDSIYGSVYSFYKYFPIIFDESFWMIFMCIISGFLLYKYHNVINNILDLINIMLKRFLRFLFPLLWLYFLIYIIMKIVPNYAYILGNIIDNTRLAFHIKILCFSDIFTEAFKTIFLSSDKFSGPFWMLGALFRANISVLIYIYIYNKINKKRKHFLNIFLFLIMLVYNYIFNNHTIGLSVVFGYMIMKYYNKLLNFLPNNKIIVLFPFIILFFVNFIHKNLFDVVFKNIFFYNFFAVNYFYLMLYCILIFIFIAKIFNMYYINIKYYKWFSEISFDFFGLHMCIICTFSCKFIYMMLCNNKNFLFSFLIILFPTFIIIILVSLLSYIVYKNIKVIILNSIENFQSKY